MQDADFDDVARFVLTAGECDEGQKQGDTDQEQSSWDTHWFLHSLVRLL